MNVAPLRVFARSIGVDIRDSNGKNLSRKDLVPRCLGKLGGGRQKRRQKQRVARAPTSHVPSIPPHLRTYDVCGTLLAESVPRLTKKDIVYHCELRGAIFQRARDLCLAKGAILSSDDWKFKFHGRYLPVLHKLPGERGNGWMADNVVIVGLMIVVVSRKREKVVTGERSVLESNQVGIMKCADILLAGGRDKRFAYNSPASNDG